jgi:hypothetical protein
MSRSADLRTRLQDRATVLDVISAHQKNHPGYCRELAQAMVDSELQCLVDESKRYWQRAAPRLAVEGLVNDAGPAR